MSVSLCSNPDLQIAAVVDDPAGQQVDTRLLALRQDAAATTQHRPAVQHGPGNCDPEA